MSKTKKKNDPFVDELLPDEEVLWRGQPELTFLQFVRIRQSFLKAVLILGVILFVLNLVAFNRIWILVIPIPIFIIVNLVDAYFEYRKFGKVFYGVTNLRILIKQNTTIVSMRLDDVTSITRKLEIKNLHSLIFNPPHDPKQQFGFWCISNVDRVYKLIYDLQSKLKQQVVQA